MVFLGLIACMILNVFSWFLLSIAAVVYRLVCYTIVIVSSWVIISFRKFSFFRSSPFSAPSWITSYVHWASRFWYAICTNDDCAPCDCLHQQADFWQRTFFSNNLGQFQRVPYFHKFSFCDVVTSLLQTFHSEPHSTNLTYWYFW